MYFLISKQFWSNVKNTILHTVSSSSRHLKKGDAMAKHLVPMLVRTRALAQWYWESAGDRHWPNVDMTIFSQWCNKGYLPLVNDSTWVTLILYLHSTAGSVRYHLQQVSNGIECVIFLSAGWWALFFVINKNLQRWMT